ncbi:hypothetical protein PG999_000530 [Apiospora kogelbergensis]|uniref:MYXO-CTERM domain-containing protein n=1 Tax=Apiospora kogelbergensis TaxID=1337665 RepID=A0AAW0RBR2_9PEZI
MKTSILFFFTVAATALATRDVGLPITSVVPASATATSSQAPSVETQDSIAPFARYGGDATTAQESEGRERRCFAKAGHSRPTGDCPGDGQMHLLRREAGWDDAAEPPEQRRHGGAVAGALIGIVVVGLATLALIMTVFWKCRVSRWKRLEAAAAAERDPEQVMMSSAAKHASVATQKPLPTVPSSQILASPPSTHNAPAPMEELISFK